MLFHLQLHCDLVRALWRQRWRRCLSSHTVWLGGGQAGSLKMTPITVSNIITITITSRITIIKIMTTHTHTQYGCEAAAVKQACWRRGSTSPSPSGSRLSWSSSRGSLPSPSAAGSRSLIRSDQIMTIVQVLEQEMERSVAKYREENRLTKQFWDWIQVLILFYSSKVL